MMILSKFTFICTPDKHWFLKITTIEELLEYWKIFNSTVQEALDTISEPKNLAEEYIMQHIFSLSSVFVHEPKSSLTKKPLKILPSIRENLSIRLC